MNPTVYGQLIVLCVLNTIFFLSGVILNTLVIITISKSTQLGRKLCHFMIMVLSYCDLITVLVGTQRFFIRFTFWQTENHNLLTPIEVYQRFGTLSVSISMLALLLMSIERYVGTYHPVFHRTSVNKRRLLTLLAITIIFPATLLVISINHDNVKVISYPLATGIFLLIYAVPFTFFNYKLFKISRKIRRRNISSQEQRIKMINLKNISSCLLAVACLVSITIPCFIFIAVSSSEGSTSNNARLAFLWLATVFRMNCSFNSLIFFWKNKILRREAIKILQR